MTTADNDGTAADFYLGRGPEASYLGTMNSDGAPEDIDVWERFQSLDDTPVTDMDYMNEVRELIDSNEWTRIVPDSTGTPWAYMWDQGSVYVYRYGVHMATIVANYSRHTRDRTGREPRDVMARQFPIVA